MKLPQTSESENKSDSPKPGISAELCRTLDEIKKQMKRTIKSVELIRCNNHSWSINRLPLPFSRST